MHYVNYPAFRNKAQFHVSANAEKVPVHVMSHYFMYSVSQQLGTGIITLGTSCKS